MGLREDLTAAMNDAMKAGDKKRLGTIRLMQAAIKDKDINSRTEGHDSVLTPDTGLVELFAKMVKQRQESIAVYQQGAQFHPFNGQQVVHQAFRIARFYIIPGNVPFANHHQGCIIFV